MSFTVNGKINDAVTDLPKTGQSTSYAIGDDGFIEAGVEWPSPRFTDNKDGTVTDTLTGLMWLKDGGCFYKSWNTALTTITDFSGNTPNISVQNIWAAIVIGPYIQI